jgi:hypothetical protein
MKRRFGRDVAEEAGSWEFGDGRSAARQSGRKRPAERRKRRERMTGGKVDEASRLVGWGLWGERKISGRTTQNRVEMLQPR